MPLCLTLLFLGVAFRRLYLVPQVLLRRLVSLWFERETL